MDIELETVQEWFSLKNDKYCHVNYCKKILSTHLADDDPLLKRDSDMERASRLYSC